MDVENSLGPRGDNASNEAHYLHSSGVAIYNADKRQRQDTGWTIAFCLLAALTIFWGIAAFVHTDPNAGMYTNSFFYLSSSCNVSTFKDVAGEDYTNDADPTFAHSFKKAIAIWLPITAVVSILSAVAYLLLFRRFAKAMVKVTIASSLAFGFIFAILCLASGAFPFGVILLVLTVLSAVFYWWIRNQLEMCAELLAIAGRGLNENLALVPASLGINVAGVCILVYSFAALFSAINIGHAEQNGSVVLRPSDEQGSCYDGYNNPIPCCVFVTESWAAAYAFFSSVFIAWAAMVVMQVKLYTVADTIAQWYFSASYTGSTAPGTVTQTSGSVRLALRHCLTTSFGSVAFAGAILALIRFIRRMLERAARNNIICCIINCIAQPLLAMMEKFTRFATIATAITGQAFVPAAKAVFDTLKRNFLQTYSIWWVPDLVLGFAVFLFSLSWSGIVFFSTYGMNKNRDDPWGVSFATAAVTFLLMFYVLAFVAGLLLDAVNALYICYAMDKDQRRVTHPEIHAVYAKVPGLAVENPDGAIMYGAPMTQPQQSAASPPYTGAYPAMQPVAPYPVVAPSYLPPPPPGGYNYVPTQNQCDRM